MSPCTLGERSNHGYWIAVDPDDAEAVAVCELLNDGKPPLVGDIGDGSFEAAKTMTRRIAAVCEHGRHLPAGLDAKTRRRVLNRLTNLFRKELDEDPEFLWRFIAS